MIPPFVTVSGARWMVLPVGVHTTDLASLAETFAINDRRKELFDGLLRASIDLYKAGCQRIYIDGSYVTGKPEPRDFDVCWDPYGVDERRLGVLRDFSDEGRAAQKARYGGDLFPSSFQEAVSGNTFLEFFQRERHGGGRKGILHVELVSDPMIQAELEP